MNDGMEQVTRAAFKKKKFRFQRAFSL